LADEYELPVSLIQESVEPFLQGALQSGFIRLSDPSHQPEPEAGKDWLATLPLMTLWLHVTNACNLKCYYCSQQAGPRVDRSAELRPAEIAALYQDLPPGTRYKTVISGGEPFIREDLLEILKVSKSYGLTYLTTNGIVDDETILLDSLPYLDEIQVSVDGPDASIHDRMRGAGSFSKTEHTLRLLKEAGFQDIWISTTATSDNVSYLTRMLRFAYTCGARGLYVGRLMPSGRSRHNPTFFADERALDKELENLWLAYTTLADFNKNNKNFNFSLQIAGDKLMRSIFGQKFHNCGLGGCGTISVAHNGDVYPCSLLHVDEFKLGNVRQSTLAEIIRKGRAEYGRLTVDNLEHCRDCEVRYICGGGCLAKSYYRTGDLQSKNPECAKHYQNVINWCWHVSPRIYHARFARENVLASDEKSDDMGELAS
jgi:radical SAM protein with 4Fe4S-binding SPASM domain